VGLNPKDSGTHSQKKKKKKKKKKCVEFNNACINNQLAMYNWVCVQMHGLGHNVSVWLKERLFDSR